MSIATELTLLANSKQAIKNSINQKGGSITDSTPFADYSTAIDNLPSGGSGNPILTSIDVSDFSGTTFNAAASYITDVTIPSGVTTIANNALQYLSITSLTIPDSVTSIGYASIANCNSLTSLTIGTGLRTVSYTAFEHCDNLTSVYYRGSLADWCGIDFGIYSFGSATLGQPLYNNANSRLHINNTAITGELTIPNTVTTLANGCFSGYKAITSVVIPNNVTSINGQVFGGCSNLTKINVGSGVTSIGTKAFRSCTGLTALIFNSTTPPTLADTDVFNNTNNCPIYVPAASVDAYKAANNWSTYASRIYPIQQVATVDGNPVYNYDLGNKDATTILSTEMAKLPTGTSIEFAEGITNMSGSISGYTTVILPSTFTTFNDQDMIGSSVTTLTMKSTTPPMAERNKFGGSGLTTIYVPASAVDTYKADSGWSNFASIIRAIPVQAKLTITLQDDSIYVVPSDGATTLNNDDLLNLIEAGDTSVKKIEVGEMITELEDIYIDGEPYGTFDNILSSELVLPASLTAMGENTFANGGVSTSIIFYAVTPPTFTGVLPGTPRLHPTIYVPAESVEAYQTAWSNYASWIQAIPTE